MRAVRIRIRLWEIRTHQDAWRARSNNHLALFKLRPPTPGLLSSLSAEPGPVRLSSGSEQSKTGLFQYLSSPLVGDRLCYLAF
jgi:hypothetical protein